MKLTMSGENVYVRVGNSIEMDTCYRRCETQRIKCTVRLNSFRCYWPNHALGLCTILYDIKLYFNMLSAIKFYSIVNFSTIDTAGSLTRH